MDTLYSFKFNNYGFRFMSVCCGPLVASNLSLLLHPSNLTPIAYVYFFLSQRYLPITIPLPTDRLILVPTLVVPINKILLAI